MSTETLKTPDNEASLDEDGAGLGTLIDPVSGAGAPGIVIANGRIGIQSSLVAPRVVAFVYGEEFPASPTLPFGRWKQLS